MTTPAAWTLMWRAQPSIFFAIAITSRALFSSFCSFLSSGIMSRAWSSVIGNPCEPNGISFAILSPTL